MITNSDGSIASHRAHYPFGEVWYASGTDTLFRFTDYKWDTESSNNYACQRYHSTRSGRFLQADPLHGNTSDAQSWNRYVYVVNDPVNFFDPFGLGTCAPGNQDCIEVTAGYLPGRVAGPSLKKTVVSESRMREVNRISDYFQVYPSPPAIPCFVNLL